MQGWTCEAECWDDDQSSGCELSLFGKQIWSSVKPDLLCPSLYRPNKSGTPSTLANWKVTPWSFIYFTLVESLRSWHAKACSNNFVGRTRGLVFEQAKRASFSVRFVTCEGMLEELVGRTCGLVFEQTSQASFFKRFVTPVPRGTAAAVAVPGGRVSVSELRDSWHAKACSKNSLEKLVVWCLNKPHKLPFLRDSWHAKACRSRISSWIIRGINPRNPVMSCDFNICY